MVSLASTSKLIGNSAYSCFLLRRDKFHRVSFHNQSTVGKAINLPLLVNLDVVDSKLYEVKSLKRHITFNLPLQVGLSVYFLAKLKMLEFVYNCIKKYILEDCFEFIQMDTDSLYLALSSNFLEELVKSELRENFFENYDYFFSSLACDQHKNEFVKI